MFYKAVNLDCLYLRVSWLALQMNKPWNLPSPDWWDRILYLCLCMRIELHSLHKGNSEHHYWGGRVAFAWHLTDLAKCISWLQTEKAKQSQYHLCGPKSEESNLGSLLMFWTRVFAIIYDWPHWLKLTEAENQNTPTVPPCLFLL